MKNETNEKALNNVQKLKLEEFLAKRKGEVEQKLRDKYSIQKDIIENRLRANTPKKVKELFASYKKVKKDRLALDEKERKIEKMMKKEGYCICSYSDKPEIDDLRENKEIQAIQKARDEKFDKLQNIYETAILKVWTGLQSETADLVDKMVKEMNKII